MDKKLVWEKYICPLGSNLKDFGESVDDKLEQAQNEWAEENGIDEDDPMYEQGPISVLKRKPADFNIYFTGFGMFTLTKNNMPDDYFNLWVGHTNFWITPEIAEQIEFTQGVEGLELFSPYRFRILVGKLFDSSEVRHEITKKLTKVDIVDVNTGSVILDEDLAKVNALKVQLKEKYLYFTIYLLPNGHISTLCSDTNDEEYMKQKQLLLEVQNNVGGFIFD
jgi:hypothetical protein